MSVGEVAPQRTHDLDFLKSIVDEDRPCISRIDEVSEDEGSRFPLHSRPKTSHGRFNDESPRSNGYHSPSSPRTPNKSPGRHIKVKVTMKDDKNHSKDYTRREHDAEGGENCALIDYKPLRRRTTRRPFSAQHPPAKHTVKVQYAMDPSIKDPAAHRLEHKYLELKELLQGSRPDVGTNNKLIKAASRMAHKYHMEALGTTPAPQVGGTRAYSPRSSALLAQLGLDGPQYLPQQLAGNKHSPRLNALQDSYILIDGTGSQVRTRQVLIASPRVSRENHIVPIPAPPTHGANQRGRRASRQVKKKKKAWGSSRTNSEVSSQKSTPGRRSSRSQSSSRSVSRSKSSSRTPSRSSSRGKKSASKSKAYAYSDSFDSSSSDSSRSRSRSKTRTVDLHLKYTDNKDLLTWLKDKDKLHRERKRKERKEKREKRKQNRLKMEEKEKMREKSEAAVEEWMKKKAKEKRLLKRKQTSSKMLDQKQAVEDWIVLDEMLDLKDYGAKINPDQVPVVQPQKRSDNQDGLTEAGLVENVSDSDNSKDQTSKPPTADVRPRSGRATSARPAERTVTGRRGRPQSAVMGHSRPASKQKIRFTEGAKEKAKQFKGKILQEKEEEKKRRKAYDEWLKSQAKASKQKAGSAKNKDPETDGEKLGQLQQPGVGADKGKKDETSEEVNLDEKTTQSEKTEDEPLKKNEEVANTTDDRETPNNAKQRPRSAEPSEKSDAASAEPKPLDDTSQSSSTTPRPKTPQTRAYKAVKHEQISWERFGDFVWQEANKVVEDDEKEMEKGEEERHEEPPQSVIEPPQTEPEPPQAVADGDLTGSPNGDKKDTDGFTEDAEIARQPCDTQEAEVDKGEEELRNKVMMSMSEKDVAPPLWLRNDASEIKDDGKTTTDKDKSESSSTNQMSNIRSEREDGILISEKGNIENDVGDSFGVRQETSSESKIQVSQGTGEIENGMTDGMAEQASSGTFLTALE